MKQNNILTIILAAAAMVFAGCNKVELAPEAEGGLKPVSISVSTSGSAATKAVSATDDETLTRCYMQILDANGAPLPDAHEFAGVRKLSQSGDEPNRFTAEDIYLDPEQAYTFLFWADSAPADATDPTDLTAVAYVKGTIAYAGKISTDDIEDWSTAAAPVISCTLGHVVSKLSLKTTTPLQAGTVVADWSYNCPAVTVSGATPAAMLEVCHFYVLVADSGSGSDTGSAAAAASSSAAVGNQTLTLHYRGPLDNPAVKIANVPLAPNYHVTLQGDVYLSGLVGGTISADVNTDWAASSGSTDIPEPEI